MLDARNDSIPTNSDGSDMGDGVQHVTIHAKRTILTEVAKQEMRTYDDGEDHEHEPPVSVLETAHVPWLKCGR